MNEKTKNALLSIVASLVCIVIGLLVGFIILYCINAENAVDGFTRIIKGGFYLKPKGIGSEIAQSAPLIMTGLSVAFAFKTGLFNIGAEGQFIVGSLVAVLVGAGLDLPAIIHIPLTLLCAAIAGALWGGIAGWLKSKFGINEVIANIMLNWIAFYLSNFVLMTSWLKVPNSETSVPIKDSAKISIDWLKGLVGPATSVNWGIVISIIIVIIIAFILAKTTLGFELRAVGFNKFGAEYAGINVNSSILKSMAIAGMIAAIAGAIQVMGVTNVITVLPAQEGYGFDGIAVALIANNNPIGVIFSGLLFGAFKYGGTKMQSVGAPSEVISIIIGSIVYFIALVHVINSCSKNQQKKKNRRGE